MSRLRYAILLALALAAATPAQADPPAPALCRVQLCNKLERFTLSPWSHFKDAMGKTCFDAVLPQDQATEGSVVSSSSRWYQGTFNPTKSSVTRVNKVYGCGIS